MKKISPYTTKLNKNTAYWMARLSFEVYKSNSEEDLSPDEAAILSSIKSDDPGYVSVYGADENSAQGAVIEHEDFLVLAFRGTDELVDWLDNVNAFSTEVLFGGFHRGFWLSQRGV